MKRFDQLNRRVNHITDSKKNEMLLAHFIFCSTQLFNGLYAMKRKRLRIGNDEPTTHLPFDIKLHLDIVCVSIWYHCVFQLLQFNMFRSANWHSHILFSLLNWPVCQPTSQFNFIQWKRIQEALKCRMKSNNNHTLHVSSWDSWLFLLIVLPLFNSNRNNFKKLKEKQKPFYYTPV